MVKERIETILVGPVYFCKGVNQICSVISNAGSLSDSQADIDSDFHRSSRHSAREKWVNILFFPLFYI